MSELYFAAGENQVETITQAQLPADRIWISYSLFIKIYSTVTLQVGRLGEFEFVAGDYIYSGSAIRGICARVNRHLRQEKKLRWHIDYLLASSAVKIEKVMLSTDPECQLVRTGGGEIVVSGFGASDCRQGCGSHLRRLKISK